MKNDDVPALPQWIARDLPFERRVVLANGHRIHAIDDGPRDAPTVVLFHGNPMWCFLWRKVIGALRATDEGRRLRIVAPDLLGFGLSDKPRAPEEHTVTLHVETMRAALRALDVRPQLLVGQDWGGPIAAGVAKTLADEGLPPDALFFLNTSVLPPKRPIRATAFHRFANRPFVSDVAFKALLFPVPVMRSVQGDRSSLGLRQLAAYAWPLRHYSDRAGPIGLARMVPHREPHPSLEALDAIGAWVAQWKGPMGLVWGQKDPILGRAFARHREAFPQAIVTATEAGHFLQEEVPAPIAETIVKLLRTR